MDEYYVNKMELKEGDGFLVDGYDPIKYEYIGLFKFDNDKTHYRGEGNFGGWYSCEYYLNTKLVAFFIQKTIPYIYSPKGEHLFEATVNKDIKEIAIRSGLCEKEIKADNDLEAISKFFKKDF